MRHVEVLTPDTAESDLAYKQDTVDIVKMRSEGSGWGPWVNILLWCAQSCPALCDPMDCNPPGSYVRGISQARILEWVAISFWQLESPNTATPVRNTEMEPHFSGIKPGTPASPALAGRFFSFLFSFLTLSHLGSLNQYDWSLNKKGELGQRQTGTEGECHANRKAEIWLMCQQAKEYQKLLSSHQELSPGGSG